MYFQTEEGKYLEHVCNVLEMYAETLIDNDGGIVEQRFLSFLREYGRMSVLDVIDELTYLYRLAGLDVPRSLTENFYLKDAWFWIDEKSLQALAHKPKKKYDFQDFEYILPMKD